MVDDRRIEKLGLSVRAYNYCKRNKISTVEELLSFYESHNNEFPYQINAGQKTINELISFCKSTLSAQSNTSLKEEIERETINNINSWNLSTRASNYCILQKLTDRQTLIDYYVVNGNSIPKKSNVGNKTVQELESLCVRFIEKDPSLVKRDITGLSNIDTFSKNKLFSLTGEDTDYINLYQQKHGHIPVFWLISKLIEYNDNAKCLAYAYGIDKKCGTKTINEMSNEMGVSDERIRQKIQIGESYFSIKTSNASNDPLKNALLLFSRDKIQYLLDKISRHDIICTYNKIISDINNCEGTNFSESFILHFLSNYSNDFIRIGDLDKKNTNAKIILINRELSRVFDFVKFNENFKVTYDSIRENTMINISEYVVDCTCWRPFTFSICDRVVNVCKEIIVSFYGIYDNGDNIYQISPKKINLKDVVYGIIYTLDSGLTLSEIQKRISEQYPTLKVSINQIETAIREDDRITFKRDGNRGTKYLISNNNTPTSIREAAVNFLDQSDGPAILDEIVACVKLHFPNTTNNSVRTSMLSDTQNRFIKYTKGNDRETVYYGLAIKNYSPDFVPRTDERRSYDERLVELKQFIKDNRQYPQTESSIENEKSLANWVKRKRSDKEVQKIIDDSRIVIWENNCQKCKEYINSHNGRIPLKDREPFLYDWLKKATEDYKNQSLNQYQAKLYINLKLAIKQ